MASPVRHRPDQLFQGAPWRVELECELALQSQLLDVVLIETAERGTRPRLPPDLPDGLEALRAHNLLTYKSQHEALDAWALDELVGHYVNYRKLTLDAHGARLPDHAFGLYAVATRYPQALAAQYRLEPATAPGLYDVAWGSQVVRLIVLNAMERAPRNAPWALFASERKRLRDAVQQYRQQARGNPADAALALIERLYLPYLSEAPEMAYTLQEFLQETKELMLAHMSAEERLKGLDPEDRLKGLDPALVEAWLNKQRQDL